MGHASAALELWNKHVGSEEGVGEWFTIDQARINAFADATLDHQFIHIDPEKAAKLSPYKVTIAHGFLTLSLIPHLGGKILGVVVPNPRAEPFLFAIPALALLGFIALLQRQRRTMLTPVTARP